MFVKYITFDQMKNGEFTLVNGTKIFQLKFLIADALNELSNKILLFYEYRQLDDNLELGECRMGPAPVVKVFILKEGTYTEKIKGPIENVPVGTEWATRKAVSQAGVHKPTQRGISGDPVHGADSIVLSGGYEDDIDGESVILYTGSGGRNNNRQIDHQTLTGVNEALAMNCAAQLNRIEGAEADNWNDCESVRVVRKIRRIVQHEANPNRWVEKTIYSYDGLFRVCSYRPVEGRHGFFVWRFLLVKDGIDRAQANAILDRLNINRG